jgi:CubicO group peptidase (beta-lactamase class C family)
MEAAALLDAIDGAAPPALELYGVPGMAVGVLVRGEQVARGYGVARLDTDEPVTPATRFRVASITKPVVATLAMRLVEEKRLSLDEPLTGLELPWELTLRHLLSHRTGLAGDWPRPLGEYGDGDDALQLMAGDEALAGPVRPGELFAYCNPGYWLTSALVERATGVLFEQALLELVLEPLGMESTSFSANGPTAACHAAEPGSQEHLVAEPLEYPRARRGSGGLYSAVEDLLHFAGHHLGGPGPLRPEARREMHTAQAEVNADAAIGLGFGVVSARGQRTLEHGGSLPGYRSLLLLVPGELAALCLLTNSNRGMLAIEDVLRSVGLALRLPSEVAVAEAELAELAGMYREPLGSEIAVSTRDGGLDFAVTEVDQLSRERVEHPVSHLRPAGGGRFVVREGDDRNDSAEFLRGGSLLRYSWLFERVAG